VYAGCVLVQFLVEQQKQRTASVGILAPEGRCTLSV